jgi:hypothetical protein
MNSYQRQYETGFRLATNIQRFSSTNYFKSLDSIRKRQNQIPTPKKYIIKKFSNEPFKDFFVLRENKRIKLRLDSINEKPPAPKINLEFIKLGEIMRNNKERNREIYQKAISLENSKYTARIREQKPIILTAKELDKMFAEHEKYVEILKSPYIMRRSNKYSPAKNPVYLPKIEKRVNAHSKTEFNLDSDNEKSHDNSMEMNDHGAQEISHQKRGHIDGATN